MKHALLVSSAAALLTVGLSAQTPTLIADINKSAKTLSSSPFPDASQIGGVYAPAYQYPQIGAYAYFTATGPQGNELYKTLGTPNSTVLVKDIYPGASSSNIAEIVVAGNKLFFEANDGTNGAELWVSDGTAAGTTLVKDLATGTTSGYANEICPLGNTGKVIFVAQENTTKGYRLYVSDGTAAGTLELADINPASTSDYFDDPCPVPGTGLTVFEGYTSTNGYELWVTDGTPAGTKMLVDINSGSSSSSPYYFVAAGNKVFFRATDTTNGSELWVTDGTATGTKVLDINVGSASSSPYLYYSAELSGKLYFQANDGTNGMALWASDGTPAGTTLIKDINTATTTTYYIYYMWTCGNKIYFEGDAGTTAGGDAVWVSDGTTAGTVQVKDVYPTSTSGTHNYFAQIGNGSQVVFYASDGTNGYELWTTDGTAANTKLLKDIWSGSSSGSPTYMTKLLTGRVIFRANDGKTGTELWATDGTAAGTQLIANINPEGNNTADSYPYYMVHRFNDFTVEANDGINGYEGHLLDPQKKTSKLIKDLYAGTSSGNMDYACRIGNKIVFSGYTAATGYELYITDGTAAGTKLLKEFRAGSTSGYPYYMKLWRGKVYFEADDGVNGDELWVTDGTTAGTMMLKDIRPGTGNSDPQQFEAMGGMLYFRANDGTNGTELWMTDGTAAGTKLAVDVYPGSSSSSPYDLTALGNKLFFEGTTSGKGYELCVWDGKTVTVLEANVGTSSGYANYIEAWNGKVWYSANNGTNGYELWSSDGTAAGTKLTVEFNPGSASGYGYYARGVGSRHLYVRGYTSTTGYELWKTDGTQTGSMMIADLWPGSSSSSPYMVIEGYDFKMGAQWGDVIFRADDGQVGDEMWKVQNGATALKVGEGYATAGTLEPMLTSDDPVLGKVINVGGTIDSGVGSVCVTLGGIADNAPKQLMPNMNFWSYIDIGQYWWIWNNQIATNNAFAFKAGIPNDTSLKGVRTMQQTWVWSPKDAAWHLSNGVSWWIGN